MANAAATPGTGWRAMDKLRALQYFIAAAEQGSFAAAARRMEVSVPSVHKLVSALEADLGVALFDRSAQGIALTASGERYLESCLPLVNELAAADDALKRSSQRPSGTLVVGAHPQLAHHVLLPALPEFHARFPEIQIDLRVINRIGDADTPMIDVFLVQGWPESPDLVHRQLGCTQVLIAASPDYLRATGVPQHPRDLAHCNCIPMRNPNGTLIDLWEFERGEESESVTVSGWLNSNAREAVLQAVLAGHGIGRFNALTTQDQVRAGRLVPVLGDWTALRGAPVNLLYRAAHRRTPRVKAFVDDLAARLRDFDATGGTVYADRPQWHRGYGRASTSTRVRG
jgi:LysR family transcriptional regulator, regulator for bpeEF and oprC